MQCTVLLQGSRGALAALVTRARNACLALLLGGIALKGYRLGNESFGSSVSRR